MYKTFQFDSDSIVSDGLCNTIEVEVFLRTGRDSVKGYLERIWDITAKRVRTLNEFDPKEQLYILNKIDSLADSIDRSEFDEEEN